MIRFLLVAALSALVLTACKKEPIVLLCQPIESYGDKVALRIDEEASTADLLNPFSLLKEKDDYFKSVFVSPTVIHLTEASKSSDWLLDRATGKLSVNNPRREYYCGTGRRF